ncbi:MAG: thiamine phosphate synthase, partial [Acidobacteriota bacterium]
MIRCQITGGTAHPEDDRWFAALSRDADFIQIREKHLSARDLARLVRRALTAGPKILVNDRADIAIATGAAGVHLRSGSVAAEEIRRIAPPGFVITVACHGAADVRLCAAADYAIVAPVFKPLSKEDSRTPLGLETLRRIVAQSPVPVIALGGITARNAASCVKAGAAGVAGITLFGP